MGSGQLAGSPQAGSHIALLCAGWKRCATFKTALVTRNDGRQYRTETKWIRFVGADAPFTVNLGVPPPELTWPATVGRSYDVLGTDEAAGPLQVLTTIVSSNSVGQWTDPNPHPTNRFYRIRTSP